VKGVAWSQSGKVLCGKMYSQIKDLPAVDAVPVVYGRWVIMVGMMPPEYHGHYECSRCQWHMKGLRNSWTREEELTYCPNCGAKMDGERRDGE
jgi:DNA-directed RNA polymerase subunit RPC12/RpoP